MGLSFYRLKKMIISRERLDRLKEQKDYLEQLLDFAKATNDKSDTTTILEIEATLRRVSVEVNFIEDYLK